MSSRPPQAPVQLFDAYGDFIIMGTEAPETASPPPKKSCFTIPVKSKHELPHLTEPLLKNKTAGSSGSLDELECWTADASAVVYITTSPRPRVQRPQPQPQPTSPSTSAATTTTHAAGPARWVGGAVDMVVNVVAVGGGKNPDDEATGEGRGFGRRQSLDTRTSGRRDQRGPHEGHCTEQDPAEHNGPACALERSKHGLDEQRASMGSRNNSSGGAGPHPHHGPFHNTEWWRSFSSSRLNDMGEAEPDPRSAEMRKVPYQSAEQMCALVHGIAMQL